MSADLNKKLQLIIAGLGGLLVIYVIFYILHKRNSDSGSLGMEGFEMGTLQTQNDKIKSNIGSNTDTLALIAAYKENIQLNTIKLLASNNKKAGSQTDQLLSKLSTQINSLDDLTAYVNSLSSTTDTTPATTADTTTAPTESSSISYLFS